MNPEVPVLFDCAGDELVGILHPAHAPVSDVGVLIVVGGPQYRVGSHRQFVLLARDLAAHGVSVLRFDYRGMGDSEGSPRDFEDIEQDIDAAIAVFRAQAAGVTRIVTCGLCDAASANAFYAAGHTGVAGQIALNPWARTAQGEAQAFIKHYYLKRLRSGAFWRKLLGLRLNPLLALQDLLRKLGRSRAADVPSAHGRAPLPDRLRAAQLAFTGPTLVILSGQDLTAREYEERVAESADWSAWLRSDRVAMRRLDAADHTFSRAEWRDQVAHWTIDWLRQLPR